MEKDELIDQHRIEVGQGRSIALSDLTPDLSLFHHGRNETQRLFEAKIYPIGERGQDRTGDKCIPTYVAHQEPKVRSFAKERDSVIDEDVKPFERGEVGRGRGSYDGQELVASSRQRLAQEMLLVLEEDVDGRRRESSLIRDFAQGPIVYPPRTEYLLGCVENVDPVLLGLGLPMRASLSSAVGLR
jgi:hypothetical protein